MKLTYFRSSLLGNLKVCEHQAYINYQLGFDSKVGKKATLGTTTHKILEVLARIKKQFDLSKKETITYIDDEIGFSLEVKKDEFLLESTLSPIEVDKINTSRINKSVYKTDASIKYNHIRYGIALVEKISNICIEHYRKHDHNKWEPIDERHVKNWVWMALDYNNGMFDPRKRTIVCTENHFDIELKEDWAGYEYFIGDQHIKGQLRLKGTIDLTTQVDNDTYEIVDWKGLPTNTKIPTPTGWSTMGDLQAGDIVFDKDGKPTQILKKSRKKYKQCYEIEFDDKSKVVCDNEHLWVLDNEKVISIQDLTKNDKINITKPLKTKKAKLPIDPYVLGVWLGDGRNRSFEISNSDEFIFDEIERRGYKLGKVMNTNFPEKAPSRVILGQTKSLRKLNLLHNKHIPAIYLRASYNQRLDLLRGLMDSDGNVNSCRKQAVFTNCNKKLSDDTKELLLSLGQRPSQAYVTFPYKDRICEVYPIAFRPIDINPFLLPRKANNINKKWGYGRSKKRTVVKITKLKIQQETQCIMVDSPSSTYLCTENMIPTHNSGQKLDFGTGLPKTYDSLHSDPQLLLYYYVASQLYPDKNIQMTIFFIRDGGPYTLCFGQKQIDQAFEMFEKTFKDIKSMKLPKLLDHKHKHFMCNRVCTYYKEKINGQRICDFIHKEIKKNGIDYVTETYTKTGHNISHYQAPGEVNK